MRTYRFRARLRRRGRSAGGLPARPLRRAPERFARGASGGRQGIVDYRLEESADDPAKIPGIVAEMGSGKLGARWTRVVVHWATLQPTAPGASSAGEHRRRRLRRRLSRPARRRGGGSARGRYPHHPDALRRPAVLAQFEGLGGFLAGRYKGSADYFECWNEPNTGGSLYPQSRPGARFFGARTYAKMLRAFHDGVKRAASSAVVIAGGHGSARRRRRLQHLAAHLRDVCP